MTILAPGDPRSSASVHLAIALPWLIYIAVLAILSVVERLAVPEAKGADRIIDVTLNLAAFIGLIVSAALSVAAMRHRLPGASRGALLTNVLAGGVGWPLLATVVVTNIAHDVDGASWMLFAPGVGLLFVLVSLLVMAAIEVRRRRRAGQAGP